MVASEHADQYDPWQIGAAGQEQGEPTADRSGLLVFQASCGGNGIGLTALRPSGKDRGLLLYVLPKLWRPEFPLSEATEDPSGSRGATFQNRLYYLPAELVSRETSIVDAPGQDAEPTWYQSFVFEQDFIELPDEWAQALATCADASGGREVVSENLDQDRTARHPLWSQVLPAQVHQAERSALRAIDGDPSPGRVVSPAGAVKRFWRLILDYAMTPADVSGHHDLPPAALDVPQNATDLKEYVYGQFLGAVEESLAHRKPLFLPTVEELSFVRGRIVPNSLVQRQARRRVSVACEYDSLSADSHVWMTVRAAVQTVSATAASLDRGEDLMARAVRSDALMRDVSLEPVQTLLSTGLSVTERLRLPDSVRTAYSLARQVLAQRFGLSIEAESDATGVLANVKFTSSALWEAMLNEDFRTLGIIVKGQAPVRVFYADSDSSDVPDKKPDFVLEASGHRWVMDAKYKPAKYRFVDASMSDQYQMATYAYRLGCQAYVVYPQTPSADSAEDSTSVWGLKHSVLLGEAGSLLDASGPGAGAHRLGVATLPFPAAGHPVSKNGRRNAVTRLAQQIGLLGETSTAAERHP